jgi:uncharacterized SAM-binding protein YcdF (DUF218 family)
VDEREDSEALEREAADLNTIIRWLAPADVNPLTRSGLEASTGRGEVDLLVLLGSSVLPSLERTAQLWRAGLARRVLVVGGVGHSTEYLRDMVRREGRFSDIPVDGRGEAEILHEILVRHYGLPPEGMLIETESTNCGSNATEARRILRAAGEDPRSLLLVQDPTMQLRSWASFRRAWDDEPGVRFLNSPALLPLLEVRAGRLAFARRDTRGLWGMARFLDLVMGEVPRLRDDEQGYGPRGRGFIVHVDLPPEVEAAYRRLVPLHGQARQAL